MESSSPAAAKASGLSTVVNTIASPSEAFETLRTAPTWGWALIIAIVLMLVGFYLQGPAQRHASVAQMQQAMATSSRFASLTPAQKQDFIARAGQKSILGYVGPIVLLFAAAFFNTIIMLLGNLVGRGQADFKRLWAGSMNIAVPTLGLGGIVIGIIATLRGPDAFNGLLDLLRAVPSLAWLIPSSSPAIVAFLASVSVFSLWGLFLNATMLRITGRTGAGVAYVFAAISLLLGAAAWAGYFSFLHTFGMA